MTIYGNYDAGRVSNPFLNGAATSGVSRKDNVEIFPGGGTKPEGNPWGVDLTTGATSETRAAEVVATTGAVLGGMINNADREADITNFFAPYVKGDLTATAFNVENSNIWGIFNPDNLV